MPPLDGGVKGFDAAGLEKNAPADERSAGAFPGNSAAGPPLRYRRPSLPVSTNRTHWPWFLKPKASHAPSLHAIRSVGSDEP